LTAGPRRRLPRRRWLALGVLALGLSACTGPEAFLEAGGPAAEEIAWIWWVMFILGVGVYIAVLGLVGVPVWRNWRRRHPPVDDERELVVERRFLFGAGIIGSSIILFVLYLVAAPVGVAVAPALGGNPDGDEITIEVVGHQFWWEVRYPDHGFVTANEITIPAGQRVRFRLESADVIHSFWIPQLHGKVDMTPGHTTELVVEAERLGEYRGRCTEYCGIAHAQMLFRVFAVEADEFEQWVDAQAEPARDPETDEQRRGREVFLSSSCVYCHTIRGHGPVSEIGPDLTHFASRETIGAGILPNTRGHLAGWIVDPQALKPGNPMPGTAIAGEELRLLLDYLESLE
jgi:cytochrome c oxidase subunit II